MDGKMNAIRVICKTCGYSYLVVLSGETELDRLLEKHDGHKVDFIDNTQRFKLGESQYLAWSEK